MIAAILGCSAYALIMGDESYRIEVSKEDDGSIRLEIINLREFKNVESAGAWCYQTHKETEGRKVWYANVVDLDFTDQFTDEQIEEICYGFIKEKVYPARIRFIDEKSIETRTYRPGFLGHDPNTKGG